MTPKEFKAWFEGFTEAFTGVPTKAQWARIKDRVAEIDGKETTERVCVDRYWPIYQKYWALNGGTAPNFTQLLSSASVSGTTQSTHTRTADMYNLGRAEAQTIAA